MIALNFHGLGDPHAAVPTDERPYWLPFAQFSRIVEMVIREHDPRHFVFTFDDGNKSDLKAADILSQNGLSGRFFLLAGRFDDPLYCSRDDARRLVEQGMTVGLHGRRHCDWTMIDQMELADETVSARAELAEAIGRPVEEVAIPFGRYNRNVMTWLKTQGFARIHTSDRGNFDPAERIWNRNTLRRDLGEQELVRILSGRPPVAQRIRGSVTTFIKRNLV